MARTGRPRQGVWQEYVCEHCEKRFIVSTGANKAGRFCSRACFYEHGKIFGRPDRRLQPTNTCQNCGKLFVAYGKKRQETQKFCSSLCAGRGKQVWSIPILSPTDAAYIAGFLDGEGSIMLINKGKRVNLRVVLAQSIRGRAVLDWISSVIGAGISVNKNTPNPKHAVGLTWVCNGRVAELLLKQLLPYLKIKHCQAELALEFRQRVTDDPSFKHNLVARSQYKQRMGLLNQRGADIRS